METPKDGGKTVYTNVHGLMTKLAATSIKIKKNLLNQKAYGFSTWYTALGIWAVPSLHEI